MGRIEETIAGRNGNVCSAKVRLASCRSLFRLINLLYPLELPAKTYLRTKEQRLHG